MGEFWATGRAGTDDGAEGAEAGGSTERAEAGGSTEATGGARGGRDTGDRPGAAAPGGDGTGAVAASTEPGVAGTHTSPAGTEAGAPGGAGTGNVAAGGADTGAAGSDLHLDLGPIGRAGGLRAGLIRALRDAVRGGRLAPGTRLPSSRSLAADLGIARNTVADAYGELVAEGWLTARQGSGTRVAPRVVPPPAAAPAPRPAGGAARARYRLTPGSPDVSAFPRAAWLGAARRALTRAPSEAFGYGDPRGRPELRTALAEYLARARGVRAHPDRIVISVGFMQNLAVLARVLRTRGGTATAVESYGLELHREVVRRAGLRTVPLPVDAHGARTGLLAGLPEVCAVLLTPAHQFPTGVPLHPDRRAAVVEWAARTGGLVLEDDYDGEFRYDRQPVGALQGLDPEHVVYLGTASKSLAPGLRLAWMVLPAHLADEVAAVKAQGEWQAGTLDQLTLAEFIGSGAYDRHLRGMRLRYRRRRDQLVRALADRAPHIRVSGIAAGLHAVLELPPGTERPVVQGAAWQGLAVHGLADYRYFGPPADTGAGAGPATGAVAPAAGDAGPGEKGPGEPGEPGEAGEAGEEGPVEWRDGLVAGYGTPPDHAFTGALEALCRALPSP
ncbi:PLP-dependent aminotransferase family protein [Streptomyces pactum]|uniref:PLP-dependent aminotransferase family protein n=1 Tax=Streptomyces pactum TaxID=68249 RepID=A0ABS0NMS8_9ACTN|nr:PLP-dependent aminotransferase family protein [Streptomyces pactum]MBH5336510.1 PLP-dependent aminotransferase family protein [Streptomyces pactum]